MILVLWFKFMGPPRLLTYDQKVNEAILRAFGADIGRNGVRLYSPITLHGAKKGYSNLRIGDRCILNGNIFLDLHAPITLEPGVSLGPGVTVMSHNRFNGNAFLEDRLRHNCGRKSVLIKRGAGIKAHALIVMGVTIGEEAVVAGGAVVNRDVPRRHFVAGVPARTIKQID